MTYILEGTMLAVSFGAGPNDKMTLGFPEHPFGFELWGFDVAFMA